MTAIFEKTFDRTLDRLVAEYAIEAWRGGELEAWLFEDEAARRAAEKRFAAAGVTARLHSAYKPLVHFFTEDAAAGAARIAVTYPVSLAAPGQRFLLEAYPLAGMVGEAEIAFTPAEAGGALEYGVEITAADGAVSRHAVFAPNRLAEDHIGEKLLSPCGWLRLRHPDGRSVDEAVETDFEHLFHETVQAIDAHPWGDSEPFFDALHIAVSMPGADTRLPVGEEAISLHEALHEDLYFSLLELFQKKSGRPLGSRGLQPGQIIPVIAAGEGAITVKVETRPLTTEPAFWPAQPLHEAEGPFSVSMVNETLEEIGGEAFEVSSRSGRAVLARYVRGTDHPIMLSGGQHPNEISGVAGALRGASLLSEREGAHFTVSPLENPDGYALHYALCQSQPHHMHHAARYTALGDDLEYREAEPLYEKAIRREAYSRTKAVLHVNLHGYPSHEWTRPLTGYIPRGFEMWTVPKGFFLVARHKPGWAERTRRLIEKVTAKLAKVPGLVAFNEAQIRLYEIHAGALQFEVLNGFPITITEVDRHDAPMTLITEYPDETVYGEAFRLAHEAQTQTVLAAYDALQEMMAENLMV
ncbi:peptidase M14 [Nitratireductor sp. L1-7-SE]|uniref:Peptidase M14 n=1 Tax=Nitratireductor rhodophyticola TaxID=2854036 RepID=A0ABS7R7S6_9HYPH|nr:peptidase M14 [Nitratireductor rhodophyticola]MBY8916982.1 peptidase M14 [Nitratireductor rhodophyticola]MBY8920589.1 peptidase M14 [Nitratireductor rhodophyticola]